MKRFEMTSAGLHIIGMICMFLDHAWATVALSQEWMTCVGRIAYPIFAFMIAEGYRRTSNVKKYMLRMLIFALISEIPFNFMCGGQIRYPYHQNVMFTFLIALCGMYLMDKVRAKGNKWLSYLLCGLIVVFTIALGFIGFVDYFGTGVAMVYVFYFFKGDDLLNKLCQFAFMYYINITLLGGYYYPVTIFGMYFEVYQQAIALLALIPIWLYRGKQGYHAKWFKYFCYAFYPAHILFLVLLGMAM